MTFMRPPSVLHPKSPIILSTLLSPKAMSKQEIRRRIYNLTKERQRYNDKH